MSDERDVVALLVARGAGAIEHPGGGLLDHLIRTSESLRAWGSASDLVLAGLAHAAYGTDGFDVALFGLDERNLVAGAIGEGAEAIVYRYASCDRAFTLPQVGRAGEVVFRDRFTGAVEAADRTALHQFAELTFANELDLVRHSEAFRHEHGAAITALFAGWKEVVSSTAYDEYDQTLNSTKRTTAP
jgi:Domain of unknown function (DUF6817)